VIFITGRFAEGTAYHRESLAAYRELGDDFGTGHLLFRLAVEAHRSGDPQLALALAEEARQQHRGRSPWAESQILSLLGDLAWGEGRQEEALAMQLRSAELLRSLESRWFQAHSLSTAGEYALLMGHPLRAQEICRESLAISSAIGDRQSIAFGLGLLAWVAVDLRQAERAGRIWGAIEAEEEHGPIGQWEAAREEYRARVFTAEGPEFERGRLDGRSLTFEEAIESALAPEVTAFDQNTSGP